MHSNRNNLSSTRWAILCPANDGNLDLLRATPQKSSTTLTHGFTGRHDVVYQQGPDPAHLPGEDKGLAQITTALVCRQPLLWRRIARTLQQPGLYRQPELTRERPGDLESLIIAATS